MHRLIVTSATYRQDSQVRPDLARSTRAIACWPASSACGWKRRWSATWPWRPAACWTRTVGGPSVFPPQPAGVDQFTQVKRKWTPSEGPSRYRRGLYTYFWRASPHPALTVFDAPDAGTTCTRRNRSNTPLQALTLLNDAGFAEFAYGLACRLLSEQPATTAALSTGLPHLSGPAAQPKRNRSADRASRQRAPACAGRYRGHRRLAAAAAARQEKRWPACRAPAARRRRSCCWRGSCSIWTNSSRGNEPGHDLRLDPLCCKRAGTSSATAGLGLGLDGPGFVSRGTNAAASETRSQPAAAEKPHFPAKAKAVIYLFMAGGPSQFELFEHKPDLQKYHGQPIPDSFLKGKRFAFMDTFSKEKPKLLGTQAQVRLPHGKSGLAISELLAVLRPGGG